MESRGDGGGGVEGGGSGSMARVGMVGATSVAGKMDDDQVHGRDILQCMRPCAPCVPILCMKHYHELYHRAKFKFTATS